MAASPDSPINPRRQINFFLALMHPYDSYHERANFCLWSKKLKHDNKKTSAWAIVKIIFILFFTRWQSKLKKIFLKEI
jgi:hypothetical protein